MNLMDVIDSMWPIDSTMGFFGNKNHVMSLRPKEGQIDIIFGIPVNCILFFIGLGV